MVQACALSEPPFAHLQNGGDGQRRCLKCQRGLWCNDFGPLPHVLRSPFQPPSHSSLELDRLQLLQLKRPKEEPRTLTPTPTSRMSATTAQLQDRSSSPRARNTYRQRAASVSLPGPQSVTPPCMALLACGGKLRLTHPGGLWEQTGQELVAQFRQPCSHGPRGSATPRAWEQHSP